MKALRFIPHSLVIAGALGMLRVATFDGFAAMAVLMCSAAAMIVGAATLQAATSKLEVLLVGALIAAIGLFGTPLFEDDYFRYLWDGFRTATTGSPYGIAPERFFFDESIAQSMREVLDKINNPEVATIYGPVLEALFYIGFLIEPGNELVLRLFWTAANLALIALLLRQVPARRVALYAWNPLVLKEVYLSGHPDAVLPLLLCAGWILSRKPIGKSFAIAIGLAGGVKVVAFAALPLLLRTKHPPLATLIAIITLALAYVPFWLLGGAQSDLDGLMVFAQRWEFNPSPVFVALRNLAGETAAKVMLAAGVIAGSTWLLAWRKNNAVIAPPLHIVFGAVLFVAPVVNPWYLLWGLAFAVYSRAIWPWAASFALLFSYATAENLGIASLAPFVVQQHAYWLQWAIIFGAICVDIKRQSLTT